MEILLWISFIIPVVLLLFVLSAGIYGWCNHTKAMEWGKKKEGPQFQSVDSYRDVAVLIACYRGAGTIGETVKAALRTGCDVYVVDDGSKQRKPSDTVDPSEDQTTEVARAAGATVLELPQNGGKPKALYEAYHQLELGSRYKAVTILDDDVTIEQHFITHTLLLMKESVAIVVGKNITWWPKELRWNIWLAKRAFSYWNYQLITRRIQSFFGVMNCISGSNSTYRVELLDQVLVERTPYIVDDTFWVLETQRRNLGQIVYAPRARAHLQDPTNLRDWYKQNLRWMWGTFQGVFGHRVGRHFTRFDLAYVLLIIQWAIYVLSAPVALVFLIIAAIFKPWLLLLYMAGYAIWIGLASWQLRQARLMLFVPAIVVTDFIYRFVFLHAFIKALRQRTVENCVWDSPARISRSN